VAVTRLGKDREGRLPFQRGHGIAGDTSGGYLGIAIQKRPAVRFAATEGAEYERLKDFNENIVESINVGIMALDMEDRSRAGTRKWKSCTRCRGGRLSRNLCGPSSPRNSSKSSYLRPAERLALITCTNSRLQTRRARLARSTWRIAPLVTRTFKVIGRLVIMDDITERVEPRAAFAADILSSSVCWPAGVAHEVNTPLAVISSYNSMLAQALQGDPQKSGLLEKITRQTFTRFRKSSATC